MTSRLLLALFASAAASSRAGAADLYVDGASGSASNAGTSSSPFKFVWQAMKAANPGDTVHLLPTTTYSQIAVTKSGTASAPIHIVGDGAAPKLTQVTGSGSNFGVWINADYVSVSNLDVTAPGAWSGIYVNAGIHHVAIYSNTVHGAGIDGIDALNADYLSITDNVVYGNASYTAGGVFGSGISVFESKDVDSNTGTKIFIERNLVYGNSNTPTCSSGCYDPDGNGIIVDDARHTESDNAAYQGRTTILNNVVFGNGGRAIHIYESDHVTVSQNTTYENNQDAYEANWRPGEVTVDYGGDIQITNNIFYTDGLQGIGNGKNTGAHVGISIQYCSTGTAAVTATNNLVYAATKDATLLSFARQNTIPVTIANNPWGDPLFVSPSLNPAAAYFNVKTGSPAITASGRLGAYQ